MCIATLTGEFTTIQIRQLISYMYYKHPRWLENRLGHENVSLIETWLKNNTKE